jgi:hypothetical protein
MKVGKGDKQRDLTYEELEQMVVDLREKCRRYKTLVKHQASAAQRRNAEIATLKAKRRREDVEMAGKLILDQMQQTMGQNGPRKNVN